MTLQAVTKVSTSALSLRRVDVCPVCPAPAPLVILQAATDGVRLKIQAVHACKFEKVFDREFKERA